MSTASKSIAEMIRTNLCNNMQENLRSILQRIEDDNWCTRERRATAANQLHARYLNSEYKLLGCGNFSSVFLHKPTGLAVKFCGLSAEPVDAYPVYARLCMERNLRYMPKIYAFLDHGRFYCAVMKVYSEEYIEYPQYPLQNLVESRCSADQISHEADRIKQENPTLADQIPDILKTCAALREVSGFGRIDLHADNVMLDKETGDFIITDPFSFVQQQREVQPERNLREHLMPRMQNVPRFRQQFMQPMIHDDFQCLRLSNFKMDMPNTDKHGPRNKEFQQFNVQPRALRENFFNINC